MNYKTRYNKLGKSVNISLPYLNWKDFQYQFQTIDGLPILVNFGEGVNVSAPGNNTSGTYSKSVASDGVVTIFNANRLTRVAFTNIFNPIHQVDWNFSLSEFRIANNLIVFDFRSGNISGDVSNLSPTLQTFQIITPSYGVLKNTGTSPSSLLTFNQTGINSEYLFADGQIKAEMPSLTQFTIGGKSQVYTNLSNLPLGLTNIEISNHLENFAANRKHRVTYTTSIAFPSGMIRYVVNCENGFGLNTASLDALLINLAGATWNSGATKLIRLSLGHGIRSSASNSAVATLTSLPNMTLILN